MDKITMANNTAGLTERISMPDTIREGQTDNNLKAVKENHVIMFNFIPDDDFFNDMCSYFYITKIVKANNPLGTLYHGAQSLSVEGYYLNAIGNYRNNVTLTLFSHPLYHSGTFVTLSYAESQMLVGLFDKKYKIYQSYKNANNILNDSILEIQEKLINS